MRLCAAAFAFFLLGLAPAAAVDSRVPKPRPPPPGEAPAATPASETVASLPPADAPVQKPRPPVEGPYIVADAASGRVIEERDALRPWFPASTSKLMTLYVVLQAIRDGEVRLDSEIVYSANAGAQPPSKMGFRPGTRITLDNALKMMMVKSANDIAVAVAEGIGGSVSGFAERMNKASEALGMTRSYWVNPHGLPDDKQRTTARDMALLARALLVEFPEYRDYHKLPGIRVGGRVLKNYNELLERYSGATGMKTGFVCASGYNLVASARRGGRELIAVVFGEYGARARTARAAELLDAGFASGVTVTDPPVMLADAASGEEYRTPLDMREYVCGAKRVRVASEANDEDGDDASAMTIAHLSPFPIYIGPPVSVTAMVPPEYGETGYVARLPRPKPGIGGAPEVVNAFAPIGDQGEAAPPAADAIGQAAGGPNPLYSVAPR